jgi:hypothetical protein
MVEHPTRIGDWEEYLVVRRMSRSAIGTPVDRCTGWLRRVHLPDGHAANDCARRCRWPGPTDGPGSWLGVGSLVEQFALG